MKGPERLPDRLAGPGGVIVRRWVPADAEALSAAVGESVEHLRPWMGWVAQEPLAPERRREMIAEWEERWRRGGDLVAGIFVDGRVAGGCGLHDRIGPDGLEIGYWLHPAFVGRGIVTTAAILLTDAAFTLQRITHVEIHHDKANQRSGAVPRRLGYRLIDESPDEPEAPAEVGISCTWRVTRDAWEGARLDRTEP